MNNPTRVTLSKAREIVDVGIITIKSEELAAVVARLPPEIEALGEAQYNIARFKDASGREYHAAIVRAWEQGDLSAQSIAHALVTDLNPCVLIIVGIAGGRPEKEFTLGDVIVGNRMFDFTVSAANNGTVEFATRSAPAHRSAGRIAANLAADAGKYGDWSSEASIGMPRPPVRITKKNLKGPEEWQQKVRESLRGYFGKGGRDRQPIVFDGAIGSSSTLMKDPLAFALWLDKSREVKAVDMEIAGAYEAARSVRGDIPVIVIRGLSDIVGFKRDERWTEYGCRAAAAFCNALLRSGVLPLGSDGDGETPTSVQWPAPMLFQPDLANRVKEEWPAIVELLAGRSRERILLYEGNSGLGKSAIIRQAAVYARKLGISVVHVDFKGGGVDLERILGDFDLEMSKHLPNFSRNGANKTHLLRRDLRGVWQPVLIIFDSYEDCVENKIVVDWLNQQFLTEVETAPALAVIIAGQKVPDFTRAAWRDLVRRLSLKPINEIKHWEAWIEQHFPEFGNKGAHLPTVVMVAQGNPALISGACEVISKS
jgi:nucleoside phosphorylase